MKWIVVWVAVFLALVVVFVAIPRPALLWVVNSLDVFGDGIGHVKIRTNSPVEPVNDGGNSVASRPTTGKGEMTVGRVLDDTLRAKFQSWYPGLFNVQNADHTEHDLAA